MLQKCFVFQSLIFFFFFSTVQLQDESVISEDLLYKCKRIVEDKPRCLIYNYNHPLCKKWDHSQCPKPHLHRESGPCVSYSCTRLEWVIPASETPTPTPPPLTTTTRTSPNQGVLPTSPPVSSEQEEKFPDDFSGQHKHKTSEKNDSLAEDLADLLNDVAELRSAQNEDIDRLKTEKDALRSELHVVKNKLKNHLDEVGREQDFNILRQEDHSIWDRLHEQEIDLQIQLQTLEQKVLKTNSTIFRRLDKIETDLANLQKFVRQSAESQVLFSKHNYFCFIFCF